MRLEKCLAGEHYDCHDQVFPEMKATARRLLREYASLAYEQKEEKTEVLRRLFGEIGTNVSVGTPFICDYGSNIHVGSNVSINMNCTFVAATGSRSGTTLSLRRTCRFTPPRIPSSWRRG